MLNKTMLIGNLGADPEIKYMPSGTPVANFSIATTEKWKDRNSGEQKEATEWHRISMFNRMAELAQQYLRKGSRVYIEGKLRTRSWEDRAGTKRYMTEVVATSMKFLSPPPDSRQTTPAPDPQAQGGQQRPEPQQTPPAEPLPFDDDIPFVHAWLVPVAGVLCGLLVIANVA